MARPLKTNGKLLVWGGGVVLAVGQAIGAHLVSDAEAVLGPSGASGVARE